MPAITRAVLLKLMRSQRYAVQSSSTQAGAPQSAVVGVAVSDDFEVVFDTVSTSRKAQNLRQRPGIAFVFVGVSPNDDRTVQFEGVADEPGGADHHRLTELYYSVFPDGRERLQWPGLTYIRATPNWIRYSDFSKEPPQITEFDRAALAKLK